MTVWCSSLRYHAVGIHVSPGPRMTDIGSNGRVILSVHLRNLINSLFWTSFGTVLTSFGTVWHCLVPVMHCLVPVMHCLVPVLDTVLDTVLGHRSWDPGYGYLGGLYGTLDMGIWEGYMGPWQGYTRPLGPGNTRRVYPPGTTPLPRVHPPAPTHVAVHGSTARRPDLNA